MESIFGDNGLAIHWGLLCVLLVKLSIVSNSLLCCQVRGEIGIPGAGGAGCKGTIPELAELSLALRLSWRVHKPCLPRLSPLAPGWTEEN